MANILGRRTHGNTQRSSRTLDLEYVLNPSNYYADLVQDQKIALVPSFTLESGRELISVPVAYKTWGRLDESGDNALVICHALSGSADAEDWWRPLMGPGKAFDYNKFFVFCANFLGSPYGSASPLTTNPETGEPYGPDFPETTFRDDVRLHKLVLDTLGVKSVLAVIGGSMGGMAALEWPLCHPDGYVKSLMPITTSAWQSAWGISWNEAQRLSITADPKYQNGWYTPVPSGQPDKGLGAARMIAMLTYRSHESFEARFSRKPAKETQKEPVWEPETGLPTPSPSDAGDIDEEESHPGKSLSSAVYKSAERSTPVKYAAQSYMQYQASKFLKRFDSNCYIHLTTKMDAHDVTRGRASSHLPNDKSCPNIDEVRRVLSAIPPRALVVSVESDVLFRNEDQVQLADWLPDARFVNLDSPDGHDGFLLEFKALGDLITAQLREHCPGAYEGDTGAEGNGMLLEEVVTSVFGEAESEF